MKLFPRQPLAAILQRSNNNLDLVRLTCSVLVIFGHASLLFPAASRPSAHWDVSMAFRYPGVYSGSIAVKVFFFISGLLVMDSLLRKKSAVQFMLGRFLRVWPALAFLLVLCAFVVGPLLTAWDPAEYFGSPAPYDYVFRNLSLNLVDTLPGVFTDNPHPGQVNGSLWTLSLEVAAYVWLLVLFATGLARHRWLATLVLVAVYLDPLLPHPLLPTSRTGNPQIAYLPPCFALGAGLALWKERIVLRWDYLALAGIALAAGRNTLVGPHLLFLTVFLGALLFAAHPLVRRWRLPADLSYGIYLWGFVVQQVVARHFADAGFAFTFLGSLAVTLLIAWCSWHLVEKPALSLAHRLGVEPAAAAGPVAQSPLA